MRECEKLKRKAYNRKSMTRAENQEERNERKGRNNAQDRGIREYRTS
jgi:hypothetical protein